MERRSQSRIAEGRMVRRAILKSAGVKPKLETAELMASVLRAAGRYRAIPEAADAYGWLVGSWELEVLHYWAKDVSGLGMKGEVHASWVLEGLAVQDVWIMPARAERSGRLDPNMNMYGTTLRVWDSTIEGWRITWRNPAGQHHEEQIGRRSGDDVVQVGVRPDGTPTRWSFTEITDDSFHWLGEAQVAHRRSIASTGPTPPRRSSVLWASMFLDFRSALWPCMEDFPASSMPL